MSVTLKDAVLFTYEEGLFTVEDTFRYGCTGIYCQSHGTFPNGFYAFEDAEEYETKEHFLANHSSEEIAISIANTIENFIEDGFASEEAVCYLYDMEKMCETKGKLEYLDIIQEYMNKAEKIIEEMETI